MIIRSAIVVLLMTSIMGCDPIYGVNRGARLDSLPDLDCISKAIRAAPGVSKVTESRGVTGREITLDGLHPPGDVYYFHFEGVPNNLISGTVMFVTSWRGFVQFSDSHLIMGSPPSQQELEATLPVMQAVEDSLSNQCGTPRLTAAAKNGA